MQEEKRKRTRGKDTKPTRKEKGKPKVETNGKVRPRKTGKAQSEPGRPKVKAAPPKRLSLKEKTDDRRSARQTREKPRKKAVQPLAEGADTVKITPLGGLNEIGKNLTLLEYEEQMLIVDCGMSFPEDDMLGIDVVIPDFTYIMENREKLVGLVVTHGHEDHVGAIPFLLKKIDVPIYATRITLGLIQNKLNEHGLQADLHPIKAGDSLTIGKFRVETIHATHSVADAICLCIRMGHLTLFHSGDFKIDYTPIDGDPIDLAAFAKIGSGGVDIMLCDSTNVLREGFTKSERYVGETLEKIFRKAKGRVIIATFSSNVHRVQTIIELAGKYGRKFSVSGRSMDNVVSLAEELGYLKVPAGAFVELSKASQVPDSKMVIITTGSQGEPMSALTRMANDEHKNIRLKPGDTVILSSTPVPGNEKAVSNVVNKLYRKGVDVIYNEIADIHVSGHACREELKLIHSLIKPHFFMPVHGETRHLMEHARLAESLGMNKKNIFVLSNGDQLIVSKKKAYTIRHLTSPEDILVDGLGIGDIGNAILKERKQLSESGLLIVAATIDTASGELAAGPEIETRGFIYVKEHEGLIESTKDVAYETIEKCLASGHIDRADLRFSVSGALRRFIFKTTGRSPIILPLFLEV